MTSTTTRRIGAKILLQDDGTAEISVFLIGADGKQELLAFHIAPDRRAAEAFVHARAADHGIGADHIGIRANRDERHFI